MADAQDEVPEMQMQSIWQHALSPEDLKRVMSGFQPSSKRQKGREKKGDMAQIIQCLAKLALKHEDAINTQLTESQFVVHLQIGDGSVVPMLLERSKQWHMEDGQRKTPLRHVLARTLMAELISRLAKLESQSEQPSVIQAMQHEILLDDNKQMPFLFWNAKTQKLEMSKDAALPVAQVKGLLDQIFQLMEPPEATLRFHGLRRMEHAIQQKHTSLPFVWQVSQRVSWELWQRIHTLSYHSIWLLVKARVKPHSASRSPAATQLQQLLK